MKLDKKFILQITYTQTLMVAATYLKLVKKPFSPRHSMSVLMQKCVKGFKMLLVSKNKAPICKPDVYCRKHSAIQFNCGNLKARILWSPKNTTHSPSL